MKLSTIFKLEKLIKIVKPFIGSLRGKGFIRPILKTALINEKHIIATDSKIAIRINHNNDIKESYLHHYKEEETSNLMHSSFPNMERLFPNTYDAQKSFKINVNEWIDIHTKTLEYVKNNKNNVVTLSNNELYTEHEYFPLSLNTEVDQISYNCKYMLMALKAFKQLGNKEINIYFHGKLRPIQFISENAEVILLPVRIEKEINKDKTYKINIKEDNGNELTTVIKEVSNIEKVDQIQVIKEENKTMDSKYIGFELLGHQGQNIQIVSFNEKFNLYQCKETKGNIVSNPLLSVSDIEILIKDQSTIIESENKMNEIAANAAAKQQQEEEKYNNVFGYCDNMSPLQKSKVLATLNKTIKYDNKIMTRKEFVKNLIDQGYKPVIFDKMTSSDRKINLERIVKYKYDVPTLKLENEYYTTTKTEYNYALYLLELVKNEEVAAVEQTIQSEENNNVIEQETNENNSAIEGIQETSAAITTNENTIVDRKEFIFNELDYFTKLINEEIETPAEGKEFLQIMNIKDNIYKFVFEKDAKGNNYRHCFKNETPICWNNIENWLRPYVWEYEKENKVNSS
jgi:hypothetical protein